MGFHRFFVTPRGLVWSMYECGLSSGNQVSISGLLLPILLAINMFLLPISLACNDITNKKKNHIKINQTTTSILYPLRVGGMIRPPYPCVSYEATKRVSRCQRVYKRGTTPASCVSSTWMPAQIAANILKPLVPNPHSTTFTHDATCC